MLLSNCYLYNYRNDLPIELEEDAFVLKTCQRQLYISLKKDKFSKEKFLSEKNAYEFFLSIICGLESPLVGETEIVAQVKEAYLNYIRSPYRHRDIQKFIEKAFHDAKIIRTKYLNSLSQKPYSYLVRKFLEPYQKDSIILLGSGLLAKDILAQTTKKFQLHLWARNQGRIQELKKNFKFNLISDFQNYKNFSIIINTINTSETIFTSQDLKTWKETGIFFLDLTSPTCRDTSFEDDKIISFDKFLFQVKNTIKKNEEKITEAKKAIEYFAKKRYFHMDV